MKELKIDLTGEICPLPLLITQRELSHLKQDDKLILEVDSTLSVRNILKWCEGMEYEFEVDESSNGLWVISIIK